MRQRFANYLRFAGLSLALLALGIVWRLTPAAYAMGPADPIYGEPQTSDHLAENPPALTEAERIAALEGEFARLDAELTHLKSALALMGPLPDHADLDLPVDTRPASPEASEAKPDVLASIRQSDLYAPPPSLAGGRTLFYEAELGSFQSKQAAEQVWGRIAKNKELSAQISAGLGPRFVSTGADTRLTAGPLASEQAVVALCVELSSLTGACRPVVPVRAY